MQLGKNRNRAWFLNLPFVTLESLGLAILKAWGESQNDPSTAGDFVKQWDVPTHSRAKAHERHEFFFLSRLRPLAREGSFC